MGQGLEKASPVGKGKRVWVSGIRNILFKLFHPNTVATGSSGNKELSANDQIKKDTDEILIALNVVSENIHALKSQHDIRAKAYIFAAKARMQVFRKDIPTTTEERSNFEKLLLNIADFNSIISYLYLAVKSGEKEDFKKHDQALGKFLENNKDLYEE